MSDRKAVIVRFAQIIKESIESTPTRERTVNGEKVVVQDSRPLNKAEKNEVLGLLGANPWIAEVLADNEEAFGYPAEALQEKQHLDSLKKAYEEAKAKFQETWGKRDGGRNEQAKKVIQAAMTGLSGKVPVGTPYKGFLMVRKPKSDDNTQNDIPTTDAPPEE